MKSKYIVQRPVNETDMMQTIARVSQDGRVGGQALFLGQVRSDKIDGKTVVAIDYSAYAEMAEKKMLEIETTIFNKYTGVRHIEIKHSLGKVEVGKASLFVLIAGGHRVQAFQAVKETVDMIKAQVPIWGKEIFEDNNYVWKK